MSTLTAKYAKLHLELMMRARFVINLRIHLTFSMNALTPKVLNRIGTIYRISLSFCTKRCICSFFKTMDFIEFIKLFHKDCKLNFVGLQKKPNTNWNIRLNMKFKKYRSIRKTIFKRNGYSLKYNYLWPSYFIHSCFNMNVSCNLLIIVIIGM